MGTTTSTANVALLRGLGADEVIDYKKRPFEQVLRDYDAVLGTLRWPAWRKAARAARWWCGCPFPELPLEL